MFIDSVTNQDEERMTVVGRFSRIDGDYIILKTGASEIKVEHKGLDNYRTKYIMVTGFIRDGVFVEESTQHVEDDFDYDLYARLSKLNSRFPDIF